MEGVADDLLIAAAARMAGIQRRLFLAEVCQKLCGGNTRQAEHRFGWGRNTIAKGIGEQELDPDAAATCPRRSIMTRRRSTNWFPSAC